MSRSALAVAGALFALGAIVWLLTTRRDVPGIETSAPVAAPAASTAPAEPASPPPASLSDPAALPGAPPRISTRDELAAVLRARGLDADRLIARYGDWRVAHGFLGPDPLAGIGQDEELASVYAAIDRSGLKSLADAGDLGAIQAYAAANLPDDPFTAIDYYRRAAELGSAAAMVEIAAVLASLGSTTSTRFQEDRSLAARLLALRGGDPARDLRLDAAAWTLAAIRLYGPIPATPAGLATIDALRRGPDPAAVTAVCGQSLAILGFLSAATESGQPSMLPPAFVAEQGLYDRLPCRDTPAPVTPPREFGACRPSPAVAGDGRPIELWICPGS